MKNLTIIKHKIDEWDPMDLLGGGAPDDEYTTEIHKIVEKFNQAENIEQLGLHIQHTFVSMFYEDDVIFSEQKCIEIARKITEEMKKSEIY